MNLIQAAGFENIQMLDISSNVRPSVLRFYNIPCGCNRIWNINSYRLSKPGLRRTNYG
jgi:hypothetical protein